MGELRPCPIVAADARVSVEKSPRMYTEKDFGYLNFLGKKFSTYFGS